MANNIPVFSFDELSVKGKVEKKLVSLFKKAGLEPVTAEVDPKMKRTAGYSFKELSITFADSQKLAFRIKQSGDIYQVLVNGKVTPIKNQESMADAVAELSGMLNAGRTKFQQKLAKAMAKLPPKIKTAVPTIRQKLIEKRDSLIELSADLDRQIAELQSA